MGYVTSRNRRAVRPSDQSIRQGVPDLGWGCLGRNRRGPDLVCLSSRCECNSGIGGWAPVRRRLSDGAAQVSVLRPFAEFRDQLTPPSFSNASTTCQVCGPTTPSTLKLKVLLQLPDRRFGLGAEASVDAAGIKAHGAHPALQTADR